MSTPAQAMTNDDDPRWERISQNLKTIGGAVLLALVIRTCLFEAFEIEGRRLRALREDLRAAIQRAEAPPAPADEARANETPAD